MYEPNISGFFFNLCISENRVSEIRRNQEPGVQRKIAWAGNTT